jgi:hypothetical protein
MDFGNMWDSEKKNYSECCYDKHFSHLDVDLDPDGDVDDIPTDQLEDSDYKCLRLIADELESGTKTVLSQIDEIEELKKESMMLSDMVDDLEKKIYEIRDLVEGSGFEETIYNMFNKGDDNMFNQSDDE